VYNQSLLPIPKINFVHLRQYDKNHCIYLARIGHRSKNSRRKRDYACAA